MKHTEIHNHLEDSGLRNAITDGLNEAYTCKLKLPERPYPFNGTSIEKTIHRINQHNDQIEELKSSIKTAERILALQTLMQYKNWKEFDVSDEVKGDGGLYRNFIGTDKEYETFMKMIATKKTDNN